MSEPTYSQILAACKAAWPECYKDASTKEAIYKNDWSAMINALIAAQAVDRNIFGDCHVGGGVGGIHFMTTTTEARDKIMGWKHDSETLAYHQKHTIPQLLALRNNERRDGW